MQRNVEFSANPAQFEVSEENGGMIVRYNDNIRSITKDDGEPAWLADVYTVTMQRTPGLQERIERSFDKFFAAAKAADAEAEKKAAAEAEKLTVEDIAEAVLELGELYAAQDDAIVELAELIEGV